MGAIKNNERIFAFTTLEKAGIIICNENCSDYDILLMCKLLYDIDPTNTFFSLTKLGADEIISVMDLPIKALHSHIYSDGGIIECRIL